MKKVMIPAHLNRFITFFEKDSPCLPKELFSSCEKPEGLELICRPLPSAKSEYCCMAKGNNGVVWYGASTGLTRYDPNAEFDEDIVMSFSADRDLPDQNVKALLSDGDGVWVLTDTGAVHIEMKMLTAEEKANILLDESVKYVDRHGMYSDKELSRPKDVSSAVTYGHSDNDGGFTACFATAELFHYAVLKREKGIDDPETQRIKKIVTRAVEACLLLMYIPRRGDGFVARSYLTPAEPVPDDGLFFRMEGGKATCLSTNMSREMGVDGMVIDASAPIPDRLSKLYRDEGFTEDGIIYKAETSSDEVTFHYTCLLWASRILAPDDPELGGIIKDAAKNLTNHIIDSGYCLRDCNGEPTRWARWYKEYFESDMGWEDAPLNAGELLFYLKAAEEIIGERGRWSEHYDKLVKEEYPELMPKHFDRIEQVSSLAGIEVFEMLMYGDNMLAVLSLWGLCELEKNDKLLNIYREAFKTWRTTLMREHNPGYDFPYILACPDEKIDYKPIEMWFRRFEPSRLAAGVRLEDRHDVPQRICIGGTREISVLLPPDERFIAKYDRNPLDFKNEDSGGVWGLESCYVYNFAYFLGRYYDMI